MKTCSTCKHLEFTGDCEKLTSALEEDPDGMGLWLYVSEPEKFGCVLHARKPRTKEEIANWERYKAGAEETRRAVSSSLADYFDPEEETGP